MTKKLMLVLVIILIATLVYSGVEAQPIPPIPYLPLFFPLQIRDHKSKESGMTQNEPLIDSTNPITLYNRRNYD